MGFTQRESGAVLVGAVVEMELDLSDRLVSPIDNEEGAAAADVGHLKVIGKFCVLARPIDVPTFAPLATSSNCRHS